MKHLPIKTTLIRIDEFHHSDFGMEQGEYDLLLAAQGEQVTVHVEVVDNYFDITLADGTEFMAISWYHLEGFSQDETIIEDEPDCDDLMPDNEADAQTLAMAGWGTEEDYGHFSGDEY